jgi:pyruvate/2-oxoglutarate dehydrogenase complex dihydrolipoamide dehydrogenase (E3) component
MTDVLVIGAGPAGVLAALRAADLGARTTLIASSEFGGTAANEGPVPVRTLAHASRLLRQARQLEQYGITVGEPRLNYSRLLGRVREVVDEVCADSSYRPQLDSYGVTVHEQAEAAKFTVRKAHPYATRFRGVESLEHSIRDVPDQYPVQCRALLRGCHLSLFARR